MKHRSKQRNAKRDHDRDPEQRARGLRDDVRAVKREAEPTANVVDLTALGPELPR